MKNDSILLSSYVLKPDMKNTALSSLIVSAKQENDN
jgi:aminopeptidase-like protein